MNTFDKEKIERINSYKKNTNFKKLSREWVTESIKNKYMYNWKWFDRPIIQLPNDIIAYGELIQEIKPDIIIETGIAHGGSIIFSASILALLDYIDALENNLLLDPQKPKRKVLAIDIDIRSHNRKELNKSPFSNRIKLFEGSSVSVEMINKIKESITKDSKVLVCLDSNHTEEHVLQELRSYGPLVSTNSYCIVMDTVIDYVPKNIFKDRNWGKGNSPLSAMNAFLKECNNNKIFDINNKPLKFKLNEEIDNKLLITSSPKGFLQRIN